MKPRCFRLGFRRIIGKYFGSPRNLVLWIISVVATVYLIDKYFFSSGTGIEGQLLLNFEDKSELPEKQEDTLRNRSCNDQPECPAGQYSYYIKAGLKEDGQPTVCFDGRIYYSTEKSAGGRGLNAIIIDERDVHVIERRTFDTFENDHIFQRYVRLGMENNQILILATTNDASQHLSRESRRTLELHGSRAAGSLGMRDSFVMIGQRGLKPPAFAVEKYIVKKDDQDFADVAEIGGCISFPMGSLTNVDALISNLTGTRQNVQSSITVPNCGMSEKCPQDTVPVSFYSGTENFKRPHICYNENMILGSGDKVHSLGRGINVLTVDPQDSRPVSFHCFDTYAYDKGAIALLDYFKTLNPNHIVLMVSHDEASTSMTKEAVKVLESMGSSFISLLNFRDVWMMVGQRDISGFAKLERLELGGPGHWPKPIDEKFCLPKKVPTVEAKQVLEAKNTPNRLLCQKYTIFKDLCAPERVDKFITAAPQLTDTTFKDSLVYNIPILLVPGSNHTSTYKQIVALLSVPGIRIETIMMVYDKKYQEAESIAELFKISKIAIPDSSSYSDLVEKALEAIWKKYPDAEYCILLEEEVIPSRDFLFFMAQCLPALQKDESLIGISAWNENGYLSRSGQTNLVYRGRMMPGLGVLLKKSFYASSMQGKMSTCCRKRSWHGWFGDGGSELNNKEMIYPDLSRVERLPISEVTDSFDLISAYMRSRVFSDGHMAILSNVDTLTSVATYDDAITGLLRDAVQVDKSVSCDKLKDFSFIPAESRERTYVLYSDQSHAKDEHGLWQYAECFGLFTVPGYKLRGLHNSVLRFTYNTNTVLLVGMQTRN